MYAFKLVYSFGQTTTSKSASSFNAFASSSLSSTCKGVLKIEGQQRGQTKLGFMEISPAGQDVERARQRRSKKVKKGQSSETTKRKKKARGEHLLGGAEGGIMAGCPDSSSSNPYASPFKECPNLMLHVELFCVID